VRAYRLGGLSPRAFLGLQGMSLGFPEISLGLIERTCTTSFWTGSIVFVMVSPYVAPAWLWGAALGVLSSMFNLGLIRRAIEKRVEPSQHHARLWGMWSVLSMLKLPLLCGSLFLLYTLLQASLQIWISPIAFAVGYGWPLVVILLKLMAIGLNGSWQKAKEAH